MGDGSITAIRVPSRPSISARPATSDLGQAAQAGQGLLVDIDPEQVDDPVLGAEVRGLHGLEEEVLGGREAIRRP